MKDFIRKIVEKMVGVYNGEHLIFPFLSRVAKLMFIVTLITPILMAIYFFFRSTKDCSIFSTMLYQYWKMIPALISLYILGVFFDALADMDEKLTIHRNK